MRKSLILLAVLGITCPFLGSKAQAAMSLEATSVNAGVHFDGLKLRKPESKKSAVDMAAGLAGKRHQKYMAKLKTPSAGAMNKGSIDGIAVPSPRDPNAPKPANEKGLALLLISGIASLVGALLLPKKAFADDPPTTSTNTVTGSTTTAVVPPNGSGDPPTRLPRYIYVPPRPLPR